MRHLFSNRGPMAAALIVGLCASWTLAQQPGKSRIRNLVREYFTSTADTQEDSVEALLLEKLIDGVGHSDDRIGFELDSQFSEAVDLVAHDLLRQPIVRDSVRQHPPELMERLENDDAVAQAGQVGRARQAGRTAADHRDPFAC